MPLGIKADMVEIGNLSMSSFSDIGLVAVESFNTPAAKATRAPLTFI